MVNTATSQRWTDNHHWQSVAITWKLVNTFKNFQKIKTSVPMPIQKLCGFFGAREQNNVIAGAAHTPTSLPQRWLLGLEMTSCEIFLNSIFIGSGSFP